RKERSPFCYPPTADVERVDLGKALILHMPGSAEQQPELLRLIRHERRKVDGVTRELSRDRRQHGLELRATLGILRQRPRLVGLHEFVPARHTREDSLECFVQQIAATSVERRVIFREVDRVCTIERVVFATWDYAVE